MKLHLIKRISDHQTTFTQNIKDRELLFTKMISNQDTAFSKTMKDQEILFVRLIRNQDGRAEAEFDKIHGKIVLIHWEMALVGAGIIGFLGTSFPWHQALTVADLIGYSLSVILLTKLWRKTSRKLLPLSRPCIIW